MGWVFIPWSALFISAFLSSNSCGLLIFIPRLFFWANNAILPRFLLFLILILTFIPFLNLNIILPLFFPLTNFTLSVRFKIYYNIF